MKLEKLNFALTLTFLLLAPILLAQSPTFDIVITNGHIVDGTGSPWYSGDLGIREGRVAAIGNLSASARKRTIDAAGRVVAPGFIDMLGQSELTILVDPRLPSKIYQGITTEITGEGSSVAPLNDAIIRAIVQATNTTKSIPTGAPSANILLGWKNRGWASIWRAMWAPHKSAASFSATTTSSPLRSNSSR